MADQARDQARHAVGKAHEMGGQARGQAEGMLRKLKKHSPGPVGWVAIIGLAGTLAVVSAIVLTLLAPVLLFFSPILVPVGIVLFLCTAGIVTAGGTGLAALLASLWLYRYYKGKHPRGADKLEHVMDRVHEIAEHLEHKGKDVVGQIPMPTIA